MPRNTAPEMPVFVENEILVCKASMAAFLASAETISGTPTVTELDSSDLTISSIQVNAASVTIRGKSVAAGKAVLFTLTGHKLARASYRLMITVVTTSGQTRNKYVRFTVDDE